MQKSRLDLRSVVSVALMTALICLTSLLTIPVFTVPITLQTFGIYSSLFLLGGKRGSIATILYIAIGAIGMPVFSGFSGGVGRLFDASGGFILGFLLSSLFFWLLTATLPKRDAFKILSAALSLILLYVLGSLWYALVYIGSPREILYMLSVCLTAFLLPDTVKIFLAYILSSRLLKII